LEFSDGTFPLHLHPKAGLFGTHSAVPDGVLTWPTQHPEIYASASVDGVPTIIDGVITTAGWVSYVKPLIYFGAFGALSGFVFWVALTWSGNEPRV
jgi:hypothetical protein